jgi:hypothetical protein
MILAAWLRPRDAAGLDTGRLISESLISLNS